MSAGVAAGFGAHGQDGSELWVRATQRTRDWQTGNLSVLAGVAGIGEHGQDNSEFWARATPQAFYAPQPRQESPGRPREPLISSASRPQGSQEAPGTLQDDGQRRSLASLLTLVELRQAATVAATTLSGLGDLFSIVLIALLAIFILLVSHHHWNFQEAFEEIKEEGVGHAFESAKDEARMIWTKAGNSEPEFSSQERKEQPCC